MSSNSTNSFNSYDYLSQDISPFRIGIFCHRCGKDDFRGNTRSLSSHVRYCKSTKTTTQSNLARRNQPDNVDVQRHDVGTDSFSFLVRKRKDPPESVHLVVPKLKEGLIVRTKARGTNSRSIQFENPSNRIDVDFDTNNHEDTDHESAYHAGIIDTSLIPSTESKQPFDMEAPIPQISQFQLDILNTLSRHRTDLKVHDEIISLIKRHSNDQCLTFSSKNLKSWSSFFERSRAEYGYCQT
jgi:hypothetical protein